jgi:hypothetical protein
MTDGLVACERCGMTRLKTCDCIYCRVFDTHLMALIGQANGDSNETDTRIR